MNKELEIVIRGPIGSGKTLMALLIENILKEKNASVLIKQTEFSNDQYQQEYINQARNNLYAHGIENINLYGFDITIIEEQTEKE